jgi:hypothetical protein
MLAFHHNFCRAIPYSRGAFRAVEILRAQGATFLRSGKPVTEPTELRDENGQPFVSTLDLQHRLLVPDTSTLEAIRIGELAADAEAFGSFGFEFDSPGVSVSQWADFPDGRSPDMLATGLLALACHFYPHLRPMYGWVDEYGWNLPDGKALASPHPKYLFWANFFGPERVQAIGREFLLKAPGWSIVDLGDGGLLHVASESYREWWANDQPEFLAYFRQKFPKLQIYRAQPIPY